MRTTLSLVLLLGCREGPAVLPLEAGPIASVKSAPTAPTTDRWACSVATDCVNACREGSVNQASLTGESMPRSVFVGDEVYAGTVNVGNPLRASVIRAASQSSLQRI